MLSISRSGCAGHGKIWQSTCWRRFFWQIWKFTIFHAHLGPRNFQVQMLKRPTYKIIWYKRRSRLRNVLRTTTACTFSTSQLPKVVREWCVLYILTSKCASRHNGVQFFVSRLASWLRTRRFSEPTFRPSRATNHWKNAVFRDFPTFSRICIFFLLTLSLLPFLLIFLFSLPLPCSAFHLSILSEVWLLNFLQLTTLTWQVGKNKIFIINTPPHSRYYITCAWSMSCFVRGRRSGFGTLTHLSSFVVIVSNCQSCWMINAYPHKAAVWSIYFDWCTSTTYPCAGAVVDFGILMEGSCVVKRPPCVASVHVAHLCI